MARVLLERFGEVQFSDAYDYGFGPVRDFLSQPRRPKSFDWVVANPPFRLAESFVAEALKVARRGVAMLARTVFLEGIGRYERIYRVTPPTTSAQFSERVAVVKGRLDPSASTATGYGWFVWDLRRAELCRRSHGSHHVGEL
jgi:hypothetical protein